MLKSVKIPEISENVTSGKIVAILVRPGDTVAVDDVLVEMETDKAVVEIPSPHAGRISEVLVTEGEEKNVGDVIVAIETEATDTGDDSDQSDTQSREPAAEKKIAITASQIRDKGATTEASRTMPDDEPEPDIVETPADQKIPTNAPETDNREAGASQAPPEKTARLIPAAPSVRRFARELGVDINRVKGSGPGGRVSQTDISDFVKQRMSEEPSAYVSGKGEGGASHQPQLPDFSRWGKIRIEKLETVRRLTAENTGTAWRVVPHVTQFDEADITDIKPFMALHAKRAEQHGGKLTLTAILMKVCAAALVRFPQFNASIDLQKQQMIYKEYVHIGLAVDTPRGLLVPVIRNVQNKGIIELATEIVDAAQRARNKKLKPEEFEGGTFTISNQGGIGGVGFTPVVLWPQAAIMGISRAQRRLVEQDGDFVPRTILPICLSYDHGIADGADAARFLDWICSSLAQGLTMFL